MVDGQATAQSEPRLTTRNDAQILNPEVWTRTVDDTRAPIVAATNADNWAELLPRSA
jgi:hypothetical protein